MAEGRTLGLVGLGTVGQGVLRQLAGPLAGTGLRIAAVAAARPGRAEHAALLKSLTSPRSPLPETTVSLDRLAGTPGIDVIIDATAGGAEVKDVLVRALRRGQDVVTANKALLARWGNEIFAAAAAPGAGRLEFEASVGGGIPIIRTLRWYLAHDTVDSVWGILNGTSNFILSRLSAGGTYTDALAEAVRRGYAEPDGGKDVSGEDALNKLVILARLAFGAAWTPEPLLADHMRGIGGIELIDFRYARERLNREIKSLAVAERSGGDAGPVNLRVGPVLLPARGAFGQVRSSYNAMLLACRNAGNQLLSGPGAGQGPTAHAMLADVLELSRRPRGGELPLPDTLRPPAPAAPAGISGHAWEHTYVRFVVRNQPGIVGSIAEAFGRQGIHIHEVLQLEHTREEIASLAALRESPHRATAEAGEALAFVVTLNRCALGQVETVVAGLAAGERFRNLCRPVVLPFEDHLPQVSAGE